MGPLFEPWLLSMSWDNTEETKTGPMSKCLLHIGLEFDVPCLDQGF